MKNLCKLIKEIFFGKKLMQNYNSTEKNRNKINVAEATLSCVVSVFEQGKDAVLITDLNGDIVYINPAFEKITGYKSAEVKHKNPRLLKSGRQSDDFYRNLWQTLTSGKVWKGTLINKNKDGTEYYAETTISPVRNNSGRIINYAAVQRDISNEVKLIKQLQQKQKFEIIGQLAASVAHDFNNTLTVINGYSDLVMSTVSENSRVSKYMNEVQKAGLRATNLTKQLLAFSRKQDIQPRIINTDEVIYDLTRMLNLLIGEDIAIKLELGAGHPPIKADPSQIEQILINLVINARDAIRMKNGFTNARRIHIKTSSFFLSESNMLRHSDLKKGNYLVIEVSDNGIGMDKETMGNIFNSFFTTKDEGKGTGLGLSIVYSIIKQNDGDIQVNSELGEGASFEIYWPCSSDPLTQEKIILGRTRYHPVMKQ
ncbi:MAG: PAS domain S-box protein [Calditrichia bacterium]|nr:PAS domain S-box protein [Calditrichia bacterium]